MDKPLWNMKEISNLFSDYGNRIRVEGWVNTRGLHFPEGLKSITLTIGIPYNPESQFFTIFAIIVGLLTDGLYGALVGSISTIIGETIWLLNNKEEVQISIPLTLKLNFSYTYGNQSVSYSLIYTYINGEWSYSGFIHP